ncbi:hypothetical protein DMC25_13870 [Caulobacter sp. D4A]|uniref:EF-hand domain-containing protein n=1 Tax=unclassified Caulobacter TaxID=2648921 RepID=UPI000D72E1E5|nr:MULTISPECIES: hypothetical protein [unclassified Caulobacter]PXA86497.1 hypothetical protein DMC25_13870 [Caulobacter sp. D4A]PXA89863.1 hypothetical protein DMC18_15870 [Caulobacter sp. D5]
MQRTKTLVALAAILSAGASLTLGGLTLAGEPLNGGLARIDKDGDGKVSPAEWTTERAGLFKKLDADRDGKVTLDEITQFYLKAAPADDPKTQKRIDAVTAADKDGNGDGKVTLAEITALADREFKGRDKDGDGFITGDDK